MRLRSRINPEEQRHHIAGPSRYKNGPNRFELVCQFCGDTYFVDELTFRQALTAMEQGIDNPFCCDECESGYEELAY